MTGTIELISPRQGMVGVETESDGFSILELLGGYSPELGDVITGDLTDLGDTTVKNKTQHESWDVYIQDIHASRKTALKMLSRS